MKHSRNSGVRSRLYSRILPAVILTIGLLGLALLLIWGPRFLSDSASLKTDRLNQDQLNALRDKVIPLIENTTTLTFLQIPEVFIADSSDIKEHIPDRNRTSIQEELVKPWHLGHYVANEHKVILFLDAIDELGNRHGLSAGMKRDFAALALVHTLVHALDIQHGRFPNQSADILKEGHAEYVTLRIFGFGDAGIRHASSVELWRWTQRERLRSWTFLTCRNSTFDVDYKEVIGFVEELYRTERLYRSGDRGLVGRVFKNPPPWRAYIGVPQQFMSDQEVDFAGRLKVTMDRVQSSLNAEGWRTLNPFHEAEYRKDPLPGPGIYHPRTATSDEPYMSFAGTYTTAKEDAQEVDRSKAPTVEIRISRFMTPDAARNYVTYAKKRAQSHNAEWQKHNPYQEIKITELDEKTVLLDRVRHRGPVSHIYHIFNARKEFVLQFNSSGRSSERDLINLWILVMAATNSEFVEPGP